MTYTHAESLVSNRGKRPKLNHEAVSMRLSSKTKHELESLAQIYGCVYGGKPWIAGFLTKIANREIRLIPPNKFMEDTSKELSTIVAFRVVVFPITGTLAWLTTILHEEFNVDIVSLSTNYIDNDTKCEISILAKISCETEPWKIFDRLKESTINDIRRAIIDDDKTDIGNEFRDKFNQDIQKSFPDQFKYQNVKQETSLIQELCQARRWVYEVFCGCKIQVRAKDRKGLVADIAKTISKYGGDILTSNVNTENNLAVFQLVIQISRINNNFTKIIEKIYDIPDVQSVDEMNIEPNEKLPLR